MTERKIDERKIDGHAAQCAMEAEQLYGTVERAMDRFRESLTGSVLQMDIAAQDVRRQSKRLIDCLHRFQLETRGFYDGIRDHIERAEAKNKEC